MHRYSTDKYPFYSSNLEINHLNIIIIILSSFSQTRYENTVITEVDLMIYAIKYKFIRHNCILQCMYVCIESQLVLIWFL